MDNTYTPHGHITEYYDESYIDYRLLWSNHDNRAMHFGYYEPGIFRHARALLNANVVLADKAELKPGERVLDAGCGVGGTSSWLAANRGVEVVGITPVASQVAKATEIAAARGLDQVSFAVDDYTDSSFADASFDVAFALESLCHASDKAAFYNEMFRVLKPGGRLVVAEYIRADRPLSEAAEQLLNRWLEGWAIGDLGTYDEHCAWSQAAGFAETVLEDGSHYTRRSLRRLYGLSLLGIPSDFVLHRLLKLRSRAQSGNVVSARDQYRSFRQGDWYYGILTARKQ